VGSETPRPFKFASKGCGSSMNKDSFHHRTKYSFCSDIIRVENSLGGLKMFRSRQISILGLYQRTQSEADVLKRLGGNQFAFWLGRMQSSSYSIEYKCRTTVKGTYSSICMRDPEYSPFSGAKYGWPNRIAMYRFSKLVINCVLFSTSFATLDKRLSISSRCISPANIASVALVFVKPGSLIVLIRGDDRAQMLKLQLN
jgi:hypothetical protein